MKDLEIIEQILIEHGRIIDHATASSYFSNISNINNKISSLIQKGLLVSLKKGVYYITKLGSLGYTSISSYALANIIGEESFVSFEGALKYHGIFDQGLRKYRSISNNQYLNKKIEETEYIYIKVKEDSYFGFETVKLDNMHIRVARKERALLDLIEYQRTIHSVSLVMEKFENYSNEIDYATLFDYMDKYSQITIKTIGLIFDLLNFDSTLIQLKLNSNRSTNRLFENSDKFSDKWRIYYDSILDK
jgi:predicted transcriptional regulator of viral defense system